MNKTVFLLDPGHGGVIDGVPQTAGKRSPDWECGVLYEGVSNRDLCKRIKKLCDQGGVPCIILVPEDRDISLRERVRRANRHKNGVYVSVHSDAWKEESANGWSAYTYYGQTRSDKLASIMYKYAKKAKFKLREDFSDGDPDKEANFYVLRETAIPAVLSENLFMTNKKDYLALNDDKKRDKLAQVHFKAFKEFYDNGY